MSVSEVMSKPLITINPDALVKDVVALMEQKDIRRLPVIDNIGLLLMISLSRSLFFTIITLPILFSYIVLETA